MKNDFIMPILILSLISLVISGALAVTNSITEPIIIQAAEERAEQARFEIIPDADGFVLVEAEGLPETIREVYASTNDAGYVFMITTSGYGGDVKLICGITSDGTIIHCATLEHSETKGLGSKITEPEFENQFDHKNKDLDGVSAISGATISSMAYINAVKDAFIAFEIVRGLGK